MSKTVLGVILAVVAILAVGGVVLVANNNDGEPTTTTTEHSDGDTHTDQSATQQSNTDTNATNDSAGQAVETVNVNISNFAFSPSTIKVKKGAKVTWTNQDSDRHDVAPDNESSAFQGSELLSKGESYSFTFNTVGTYSYHCTPHPYMKGTVEVTE